MNIDERQLLRNRTLKRLYDKYFETKGIGEIVDKHELEKNTEEFLAFQYLVEKGLVHKEQAGGSNFYYRITVYGIDIIESGRYIEKSS